jgi:hypothetical protein
MTNYNIPNGVTTPETEGDEIERIDRKIEREEERGEQLRQAEIDREMGL